MKRYLADVNVWFALAVEEHEHHGEARKWWEETPGSIGFVRITQLGLLRLLTSSGPMRGQPLTNVQAWAVYDGFLSDDRVRIFPEVPAIDEVFRSFSGVPQSAPKRWVDAYLAAHAAAGEATLVTFDQALAGGYRVACQVLGAGA
jgi:toxin-antitoxin system PIN domain toxin